MNRRLVAAAFLAATLLVAGRVRAHEGHAHKVMGTLATRLENRLQVKQTNGKLADITLNEKTKIVRAGKKSTFADIGNGERLVVTAVETKTKDGKTILVATQINLAAVAKK